MAEPTSLTGFDLPLALQKTHDAEQFFLHDSGSQDENRVFELAKIPGLDQLSLSDGYFCDGRFSTVPYVFYQIYLTHFHLKNALLLLFTACYPTKGIILLSPSQCSKKL